jgi:hypothetical protein
MPPSGVGYDDSSGEFDIDDARDDGVSRLGRNARLACSQPAPGLRGLTTRVSAGLLRVDTLGV